MAPDCSASKRPYRVMYTVLSVIGVSVLLAAAIDWRLLWGRPRIIVLVGVLAMAGLFTLATVREFSRQARVLSRLCGECSGDLVYVPRRLVYACRSGAGLLCYSTANGRVLRVSPGDELSRAGFDPWRDPVDFYCVKPLEGRMEKRGGRAVFEGVFLYIDPYGPSIVKARGRVVSERAY